MFDYRFAWFYLSIYSELFIFARGLLLPNRKAGSNTCHVLRLPRQGRAKWPKSNILFPNFKFVSNIICHAHRLHGLFSGVIITANINRKTNAQERNDRKEDKYDPAPFAPYSLHSGHTASPRSGVSCPSNPWHPVSTSCQGGDMLPIRQTAKQ